MKKSILVCLAIGLVLSFGTIAMAGVNPGTGITQTSHDLSSATGRGSFWNAGTAADPTLDRICIYCHAPHFSITPAAAAAAGLTYYPLWNHAVSTITTYQTYTNGPDSPTGLQHQLNATLGQPAGVSKLCLSCHDGSAAISSYGYSPSSSTHVGSIAASGRILIGNGTGDLRNHHPIGFDYDSVALVDDEINPSSSSLLGANLYGLTIADLLWNGKVECSTCHDVHNTKNEGIKFTWVQDTGSRFCLTCHNK